MKNLTKQNILGVDITNASKEEVLEFITKSLEEKGKPYYIVTPNPEMVVLANHQSSFKTILNQAQIALADGVGLVMAARTLRKPRLSRFTGVDCMEELCKRFMKKPITVGFLGGRDRVAELTAECLLRRYPELRVVFVGEEWPGDVANGKEKKRSKETISHKPYAISHIDILFVAFGFPKQEEWMAEHVGNIPVQVMMGVGGAFDYISGRVPRAPRFLQAIGLEWFYRLISQPWRLKRQLALLYFILLLFRTRFSQ